MHGPTCIGWVSLTLGTHKMPDYATELANPKHNDHRLLLDGNFHDTVCRSPKITLNSISLRFLYEPQKHFRIYLEVAGSNKRSSQKSSRGGCSAPRTGGAGYNYVHPGAPRCPSGSTARAPSPRCAARAAGSRSPRRGLCGDECTPPFVAAIRFSIGILNTNESGGAQWQEALV